MMKNLVFLVIALTHMIVCYPQKNAQQFIPVMDIVKKKPVKVYFEKYFSEVEFIPLSTSKQSSLGIIVQMEVDDKHFYIRDHFNTITIFNLDGSYVNRIQKLGNGPGEIVHIGLFHLMDEDKKLVIYDDFQRKLFFFSTEGEYIRDHKFNFSIDGLSHVTGGTLILFTDGVYNISDTPAHVLSYIDIEKMEVTNKLHLLTRQRIKSPVSYIRPKFSRNENGVILQIPFSDTLFQINESSYSTKIIFQLNKTGLRPEMLKDRKSRDEVARFTTQCSTPFETSRFLLFRVDYKGKAKIIILDKTTNEWKLLDSFSNQKPGFLLKGVDQVSFTPLLTTNEYYFSFIEAIDFISYFPELYPELADKVSEDDNQIIVRARIR